VKLSAVRDALLAEARADAARLLEEADARAAATRAAAEQAGEELVRAAREEGDAAAALEGAHDGARARRTARALVLAAQREVYDELRNSARARAQELRASPDYKALLERYASAARAQLGADATVALDPAGGLRATAGTRSVDYTLDAVVDRAVDAIGERTAALWS
jgi:vacuolar-type H+-ATPase subunit E/Vma4